MISNMVAVGKATHKRNVSIELYRMMLVYGIVLLHVALHYGGHFYWLKSGLAWCVDGFVFISGYFGIKFTWRKLLKLYGTAIFLSCLLVLIFDMSYDVTFLTKVLEHVKGIWFLHAYALMMCLTPIVNHVLADQDRKKQLVPFFAVVFCWGLCLELPFVHKVVPTTAGIGSFTGLTLLGIYAIGRLYRLERWDRFMSCGRVMFSLPILLVLCGLGYGWLGHYCSPVAVAAAMCFFWLFERLQMPIPLQRLVSLIAPSAFAIYVVHTHPSFVPYMHKGIASLGGRVGALFPVAAILYGASIVCDIPRRVMFYFVMKVGHALIRHR